MLLDDVVRPVRLDHVFDVRNGVSRHDEKPPGVLPRAVVLPHRDDQPLLAAGRGALADDVEVPVRIAGAELGDPVVHLAEENLVPREPVFAWGHVRTVPARLDGPPVGQPESMDRARGLSEQERRDLLARIDRLLGDTPKGRLVKEIVEDLPSDDELPAEEDVQPTAVPEAD